MLEQLLRLVSKQGVMDEVGERNNHPIHPNTKYFNHGNLTCFTILGSSFSTFKPVFADTMTAFEPSSSKLS
jgi:hypothetical protein